MVTYNPHLTIPLRKKLRLTQPGLAELLGVKEKQIYRYEKGIQQPKMNAVLILYELYKANGFTTFPLMIDDEKQPIEFPIQGAEPENLGVTKSQSLGELSDKFIQNRFYRTQ